MKIRLVVNGDAREADVWAGESLLTTLRDTLYQSLSAIIAGVALIDPSFAKVALELSKAGAAKLGIA